MKKWRTLLFVLGLSLVFSVSGKAEENTEADRFWKEFEFYREAYNVPTAFEAESWAVYNKACKALRNMNPEALEEKVLEKLQKAEEAHAQLIQEKEMEECIWYIWDEAMPICEEEEELVFGANTFDGEDFCPFLLPYLQEDQESVKGNLIVVAGGGYTTRANDNEGYGAAECFFEKGYNCYVLQRRVFPYGKEDIWLDLQRSIRYLRFHAEELGLGGMDLMGAIGFSGGSGTVLGAVAYCYGEITPDAFDADYVPDEVDQVNSDLDAAIAMYGPNAAMASDYQGLETENENLPEIFIAAGQLDNTGAGKDSLTLAASLYDKTKVEFHLFADARHGFTLGAGMNNTAYWPDMADDFLGRVGN